jgi:hypothetical protein
VDLYGSAELGHAPARVFAAIADLSTYPQWLGIVLEVREAEPHEADTGPAWFVDLGARLGPLRRTKQVRMVRVVHEPETRVRFERHEHDGREHSAWVLAGAVDPLDDVSSCRARMDLHYGGAGWIPGLDRILRQEIRRAPRRLDKNLRQ